MKYDFSKKFRRFLVIWIVFHSIALLSNIIIPEYHTETFSYKDDNDYRNTYKNVIYYLTNSSSKHKEKEKSFWPLVKFNENTVEFSQNKQRDYNGVLGYENSYNQFNGIFYQYDYAEFIFYCVLPFIIIALRRLWK
jgi:hypothetical protein